MRRAAYDTRRVYEARREGRWVVLRRRRPAVHRWTWLGLAVPVGLGAAAAGWRLVGEAAGPTMRAAYAVVMFGLVAGIIGLVRGGRR